jgi:putative FmdB family regulatory protein
VPLYEYRCLDCDDVFEARRSMADADDARCPDGHDRVKRLLSRFAVGARAASPAPPAGGCCGGACGCG